MKHLSIIIAATCFFVLSGCQTQQKKMSELNLPSLTSEQLTMLFDTSIEVEWQTNKSFGNTKYHPDGTGVVNWGEGDHAGNWRILDNSICTRWEGVRNAQEKCFKWVESAPSVYENYNIDGGWEGRSKLVSR